jgi:hypothetical protein
VRLSGDSSHELGSSNRSGQAPVGRDQDGVFRLSEHGVARVVDAQLARDCKSHGRRNDLLELANLEWHTADEGDAAERFVEAQPGQC